MYCKRVVYIGDCSVKVTGVWCAIIGVTKIKLTLSVQKLSLGDFGVIASLKLHSPNRLAVSVPAAHGATIGRTGILWHDTQTSYLLNLPGWCLVHQP